MIEASMKGGAIGALGMWLVACNAPGCSLSDGCGPGAATHVRQVRWPASHDVSLDDELRATARTARPGPPAQPPAPPGPELPPDTPGLSATAFEFEGLWVSEVRIGEVEPGVPLPLVMMLHGRGDSPRVPGGPFGRVPTPMRVLIPRGPLMLGSGFAWARHSVTQGRHAELAEDLLSQAQRLARLIDEVRRTRPTAGTPIVTGFSQGAMLAWVMALQHTQAVGLALPIAGWVPPAARPPTLQSAPTRAMHGDADPIVRIEPTRVLVRELRDAGDEVEWREFEGVAHEVTPEMNAQFEDWLEQALAARAPNLMGGLGQAGIDPEPMKPYEPALEIDLEEVATDPSEADETAEGEAPPEDEETAEGEMPANAEEAREGAAPAEGSR